MYKDIIPFISGQESKTFSLIKPLNGSLYHTLFHLLHVQINVKLFTPNLSLQEGGGLKKPFSILPNNETD